MPCCIVDDQLIMQDVSKTFSNNMKSLMEARKIPSDSALAKLAHCDQKTIYRIKNLTQEPTIAMAERIAAAFGLTAWQMMIPNIDPDNPPMLALNKRESASYTRLTDSIREFNDPGPTKPYGSAQ